MALKTRSDFESVLRHEHLGVAQVMRIYPYGMSLDWMMEHLVRREALNLRMTSAPPDPTVDRAAKNRVLITR